MRRALHALLWALALVLTLLAPLWARAISVNLASLPAVGVSVPAALRDLTSSALAAAPHTAGSLALAQGHDAEAAALLTRALAAGHDRDVTRLQLGEALARAGRMDEALAQWKAADAAPYFLRRGLAARHRHDWDAAAEAFATALAIAPADPRYLAVVGYFYWEWEKPVDARVYLQQALATEIRVYERLLLEGDVARLEERPGDARHALERAMRLQPSRPDAYVRLADLLFALEQPEDAVRVLRSGLRDAEQDIAVHARLAAWLTEQAQYAEADRLLQSAQRINPRSDEPWLWRARNAIAWQRPDAAAEYLQRALLIEPHNAETLALLARLRALQGQ